MSTWLLRATVVALSFFMIQEAYAASFDLPTGIYRKGNAHYGSYSAAPGTTKEFYIENNGSTVYIYDIDRGWQYTFALNSNAEQTVHKNFTNADLFKNKAKSIRQIVDELTVTSTSVSDDGLVLTGTTHAHVSFAAMEEKTHLSADVPFEVMRENCQQIYDDKGEWLGHTYGGATVPCLSWKINKPSITYVNAHLGSLSANWLNKAIGIAVQATIEIIAAFTDRPLESRKEYLYFHRACEECGANQIP